MPGSGSGAAAAFQKPASSLSIATLFGRQSREIIQIALKGEQMLALTQVVGIVACGIEALQRIAWLAGNEGLRAERAMSVNILRRCQPFAALPGTEAAFFDDR